MPRPYIYSLYGHTAIRYNDKAKGIDVAINYGMFSFSKPFFLLRFVFGLTDYEMGIEYFDDFRREYERTGCGVRQQDLNLSAQEKANLSAAIEHNYMPQNRVYRYNYFYDNCTTRARDILTKNIKRTIGYNEKKNVMEYPSFRELIHKYNEHHRWARFGNDLLLGVNADKPTTFEEQQFLPDNLRKDFDSATLTDENGNVENLVKNDFWILPATNNTNVGDCIFTPMLCMCLLAFLILAITTIEKIKKANYWLIDAALMTTTGICGIILLLMVFSQHPTVRLNLQILFLNPLNIVFLWNTIKKIKAGKSCKWNKIYAIFLILFLLGSFLQSYAEGLAIVALSLLFRILIKNSTTAINKSI